MISGQSVRVFGSNWPSAARRLYPRGCLLGFPVSLHPGDVLCPRCGAGGPRRSRQGPIARAPRSKEGSRGTQVAARLRRLLWGSPAKQSKRNVVQRLQSVASNSVTRLTVLYSRLPQGDHRRRAPWWRCSRHLTSRFLQGRCCGRRTTATCETRRPRFGGHSGPSRRPRRPTLGPSLRVSGPGGGYGSCMQQAADCHAQSPGSLAGPRGRLPTLPTGHPHDGSPRMHSCPSGTLRGPLGHRRSRTRFAYSLETVANEF